MSMIGITLNGERLELPAGSSVSEMLSIAEADRKPVAVVVNERIVRPEERETHILHPNDQVEVLVFAGGG